MGSRVCVRERTRVGQNPQGLEMAAGTEGHSRGPLALCFLRPWCRPGLLASGAGPSPVTVASKGLPGPSAAPWRQVQEGFLLSRVSPGTAPVAVAPLAAAGCGRPGHAGHVGAQGAHQVVVKAPALLLGKGGAVSVCPLHGPGTPSLGPPAWAAWQWGAGSDHLGAGEAQVAPEHHAGCPQRRAHADGPHEVILEAEGPAELPRPTPPRACPRLPETSLTQRPNRIPPLKRAPRHRAPPLRECLLSDQGPKAGGASPRAEPHLADAPR